MSEQHSAISVGCMCQLGSLPCSHRILVAALVLVVCQGQLAGGQQGFQIQEGLKALQLACHGLGPRQVLKLQAKRWGRTVLALLPCTHWLAYSRCRALYRRNQAVSPSMTAGVEQPMCYAPPTCKMCSCSRRGKAFIHFSILGA